MSKHTPGPWEIERYSSGLIQIVGDVREISEDEEEGTVIVEQLAMGHEADANLIAAAPELFDELVKADNQMQMAYQCIEAGRYDEALLHLGSMSRPRTAAIARAKGQQND